VGFFGGGFFMWMYPKKPTGFFWVRTRVSEPWFQPTSLLNDDLKHCLLAASVSVILLSLVFFPLVLLIEHQFSITFLL